MQCKIWLHLIQILSYRKDLINTIKPLLTDLINHNKNERYNINEQQFNEFLEALSKTQLELLCKNEIISKEKYSSLIVKKELPLKNTQKSSNGHEEILKEIIKGDKLEELQRLITVKGINAIIPINKPFKEVEKMSIPIIHYCVIKNAMNCFKFFLINGIEDPTKPMQEQNPNPNPNIYWLNQDRYTIYTISSCTIR